MWVRFPRWRDVYIHTYIRAYAHTYTRTCGSVAGNGGCSEAVVAGIEKVTSREGNEPDWWSGREHRRFKWVV
eukprot:5633847-Lingulodinium_polyedra.AAC.1